jgi:hypothetical protein
VPAAQALDGQTAAAAGGAAEQPTAGEEAEQPAWRHVDASGHPSGGSGSGSGSGGLSERPRLVRGCGDVRLAAAAAAVGAGGPFAWERRPWSGAAFDACPLLNELLPSVLAGLGYAESRGVEGGGAGPEPPMAQVLKGCPNMATCLRYGEVGDGRGKRWVQLEFRWLFA